LHLPHTSGTVTDEYGTQGNEWHEKLKYLLKNLPQCHSAYHKSHMDCPGIEPRPPQWEAGI